MTDTSAEGMDDLIKGAPDGVLHPYHLKKWTDDDLRQHAVGVRLTAIWAHDQQRRADRLADQLAAARAERDEAREEAERFKKLDQEAATYVETVICMRTHFTGDEPYVGWKGLALALREHLDSMDAKLAAAYEECAVIADQYGRENGPGDVGDRAGELAQQNATAIAEMIRQRAGTRG